MAIRGSVSCCVFLLFLKLAAGQKCNDEGFHCVSKTQWQDCVDDDPPSGQVNSCPQGTFCSMDCDNVCKADVPCTKTKGAETTTEDFTTAADTTTEVFTAAADTTTEVFTTAADTTPDVLTTSADTTTEVFTKAGTTTEIFTTAADTTTELANATDVTLPTPQPTKPSTDVPSRDFKCEANGRFPDYENCSNYYVCINKGDGSWFMVHQVCPMKATWNSVTKRCSLDPNAVCGVAPPATTPRYSRCTSAGKVPDDRNCSLYYVCTPTGANGGFHESMYHCPDSSKFNAATKRCSKAANIACGDYTELPIIKDEDNMCRKEGKFGNPKNCFFYYTCTRNLKGNYVQLDHICPLNSRYDTYRKRCSYSILTICA